MASPDDLNEGGGGGGTISTHLRYSVYSGAIQVVILNIALLSNNKMHINIYYI